MSSLPQSRVWILFAAWGCVAGAVLHIITVFAGPTWFDFLGAPPSYGQMMRDGDWLYPASVTFGIAAILGIWAAYAFSTLEERKSLPFARAVCGLVAAIFFLRGLIGIPLMIFVFTKTGPTLLTVFHLAVSIFIVLLGVGFWTGFKQAKL